MVGGITTVVGYWLAGGFSTGFDNGPLGVDPLISWSVLFGTVLVEYAIVRHYQHAELDAREAAFSHYTRDLGDRLNVCAHGIEVVPCEQPLPQPPTTPTTTASLRMR